jgi:hypothetical protein
MEQIDIQILENRVGCRDQKRDRDAVKITASRASAAWGVVGDEGTVLDESEVGVVLLSGAETVKEDDWNTGPLRTRADTLKSTPSTVRSTVVGCSA